MLHLIGPNDLHPSTITHIKTFQVFLICFPKCPKFQHQTKLWSKCSGLPFPIFYIEVQFSGEKSLLFGWIW